jgi:zinc-binding in reverse transcriptase
MSRVNSTIYTFVKDVPLCSSLKNIWFIEAPPRILTFSRLMLRNSILTIDNFNKKKRWQMINMYILCKNAQEIVHHLFNNCYFFQNLWLQAQFMFKLILNGINIKFHSLYRLIKKRFYKLSQIIFAQLILMIIIFITWREMC